MRVVRFLPEWFPGGGWKKTAKALEADFNEMVDMPYNWVKERIVRRVHLLLVRSDCFLITVTI